MVVEKGRIAAWVSVAVLGGAAVCAPGCSSSSPTSTSGLDSGLPDAIVGGGESGAADAGNDSACNRCTTEAAGGACRSFVMACLLDTVCRALVTCANKCAATDTSCLGDCVSTADSTALGEYQALGDCICGSACTAQCAAECGKSPDGGTTSVDGSSTAEDGGDLCAAAGCPTLTTTSQANIDAYCPTPFTTTRVCDCPGAGPGAPCTTAPQGANLYCCP